MNAHDPHSYIATYAHGYVCRREPLKRLFPHMKTKRPVYAVTDPDGNYVGYVDTQREAQLLAAHDWSSKTSQSAPDGQATATPDGAPRNQPQLDPRDRTKIDARAEEMAGDAFDRLQDEARNWLRELDIAQLLDLTFAAIHRERLPTDDDASLRLSFYVDMLRQRFIRESAQLFRAEAEREIMETAEEES